MNKTDQAVQSSQSTTKTDSKAVKPREPLLGIAVGKKGVGKTYATLKTVQTYLKGNPKIGVKPRRVLILDVNNEYGNVKGDVNPDFLHIKAIALTDIPRFCVHPKIEARRVTIFKPDGKKMNLLEIQEALDYILQNYHNGLLIIEDITKFISDNLPNDLIGAIATQRHVSVDIVTHFQSIGKAANPKLWANANWIRYHKCDDTVLRHKDKFAGEIEHLMILEKMVHLEYEKDNIRFHAYLDKDDGKIKGAFDLNTFKNALNVYLEENPSIFKKEYNREDMRTGQKIHKSRDGAASYLIDKYITNFYGNKK